MGNELRAEQYGERQEPELAPSEQARLESWRSSGDFVSIGNLGEWITGRLLIELDYQVLAGQNDLLGMATDVPELTKHSNPEDFVAVDPTGRLVTVNSKASVAPRACRVLRSGNLSAPRLARGQNGISYSTFRANIFTPLEGESYSQVVKVDLMHLKAQVFEVEQATRLIALEYPRDISLLAHDVLREFPNRIPPPNAWDLA